MKKFFVCSLIVVLGMSLSAQNQEGYNTNKFKQLYKELPTPTSYRTASGAPGHEYYQQKADYKIDLRLDDKNQRLYGEETITYHNESPDPLTYLWVQLDQNRRAPNSNTYKVGTNSINNNKMSFYQFERMQTKFEGGFNIEFVKDANGNNLPFTINQTMMRIDLLSPLAPSNEVSFSIKWWYNINNRAEIGGRSGYEYFEDEGNYLYTIAQFFPRMAVYNETEGWQNKQFLGRGEFALPFGDYEVSITVPSDHVVAATGVWQNSNQVLTEEQKQRLEQAKKETEQPVFIVNQKEAEKNEKKKASDEKTWIYKAENVRDFAFASSRKFIWDAMAVNFGDRTVLAMSYYPKEGNPLWERYSTKVVAHTLKIYSKYTIEYPYPVAISVHTDRIGMEYPMICFNGGRPDDDGTYSERTKYGMIGVIIHEVGHNFFPMIINSDERQWTWMDEGLNTFVQYLTEVEWDRDYPSRRGPAYKIVDYMKGDKGGISPIMTNSESVKQFGNNAYGKPATALNILRETVMGRELFDYAFKTYCERWAFKHPTPADFFRTMEDASAVDLDWFWRGWFYTTQHVDISLDQVTAFRLNTKDPDVELKWERAQLEAQPEFIGDIRNKEFIPESYIEKDPSLKDFYNKYDPLTPSVIDYEDYKSYLKPLDDDEKEMLKSKQNFYQVNLSNVGGLVMPVILQFNFSDGSNEIIRIPAEIWKMGNNQISKVFNFKKEVTEVILDPHRETADVDETNNYFPRKMIPTRFELYKSRNFKKDHPMKRMKEATKLKDFE